MPIIRNELGANAKGGTELMIARLEKSLPFDLLTKFDIYPSRVRSFNSSRPSIYWVHDLVRDGEVEHLKEDQGKRFSLIVFVSNWQYQQFQGHYQLDGNNCTVINNAIQPFHYTVPDNKWEEQEDKLGSSQNPIRLIYHTTPHRGLELLVPVFEHLHKELASEGIHVILDVFSSFSIYGWENRDEPYAPLFERCCQHPAINYHGAMSNDEVRKALEVAHVFAFPSIWQETSCLAMIEAMSAGVFCVHPNLAALIETSGGFSAQYGFVADINAHANRFYAALHETCKQLIAGTITDVVTLAKQRADLIYNWEYKALEWQNVLRSLESRLTYA